MKSQYGQDFKLRTWLKSLVSLALVPTKNVQDEFIDLLEQMHGTLLNKIIITLLPSAAGLKCSKKVTILYHRPTIF